jgi:hypothetical protein
MYLFLNAENVVDDHWVYSAFEGSEVGNADRFITAQSMREIR